MPESPATENPAPNPEAIAWYLARAEDLLDDLRERLLSLRTRGGQLAGFSGAVITLVGANAGSLLSGLDGAARHSAAVALLSGTVLLVAAFLTALRGASLPRFVSDTSSAEIDEYTTRRLINEPDLWRVHLRTIHGLVLSIQITGRQQDNAAVAVERAGRLFVGGLLSVAVSLCILIVVRGF